DTLTATGLACSVAVSAVARASCPLVSAPVVLCPPDTMVQCFSDLPPPDTNSVRVIGGIPPVTVLLLSNVFVTNGCFITNIRTYAATDACSNLVTCNQTLTVANTTPPSLTCAPNQVVECGVPFDFTPPTVIDVCRGTNVLVEIVSTVTNATCGRTFFATRTWKATDTCSNMTLCSQTIAVVDTRPPSLT